MATYTYLDMNGLRTYDGLIKQYIGAADAKAIKYGKIEDGYLKLYKDESPAANATPDFNLQLPIGDFAKKVANPTADDIAVLTADGDLADGGAKISDLETKAHAGEIPNGATASTIVGYAAEVAAAAEQAAKDARVVTIEADETGLVYTIKQGGNAAANVIGTINIPADMVVSSGIVATYEAGDLPTGVSEAGTYIVLTIANATNDKLYIKATDLVDVYRAQASAAQVQLTINPANNEISAAIVAGSIGTTELADGAVTTAKLDASAVTTAKIADANVTADKLAADSVTTAKIVDGNVTLAKLATDVQTSLGKADTALQSDDFASITTAEIEGLFE